MLSSLTEAEFVLDRLSWEFGIASRRSQGRGTALLGTRAEAYHKSLSGEPATAFSVTRTSYGQNGITRQGLEQDPNKGLANIFPTSDYHRRVFSAGACFDRTRPSRHLDDWIYALIRHTTSLVEYSGPSPRSDVLRIYLRHEIKDSILDSSYTQHVRAMQSEKANEDVLKLCTEMDIKNTLIEWYIHRSHCLV